MSGRVSMKSCLAQKKFREGIFSESSSSMQFPVLRSPKSLQSINHEISSNAKMISLESPQV